MTVADCKDIAWNGIRFSFPAAWQIAAIGQSHLMLEGSRGPTMEVIWRRIKGRFSHQRHLKRLAARFPRKMAGAFRQWPLPLSWQEAVCGFDASGFEWRSGGEHGRGVLLYCGVCRRASLVHFFSHHLDGSERDLPALLQSYSDHYAEGGQLFSVFDMRATLPVPFRLEHFRLQAGRFELVFGHRRNRITLHRWALAAIALKDKTLASFGLEAGMLNPLSAREITVAGFNGVDDRRAAAGAQAWLLWLTARPGHYWCRLWHAEPCNRILGVVAETRRPMDAELFERICLHYETF